MSGKAEEATFAGGCFWCVEATFDHIDGVLSTTSGYTGGKEEHPSYEEVSAGKTGHAESVLVVYDPNKVTYQELLKAFWHSIDPTTVNRQFCDIGSQYRSIIFYHNEEQRALAEASKQAIIDEGRISPVVTDILPAGPFYPAEDYHQDYHIKNAVRYKFYRYLCGRDERLHELWGDDAD